MLAVSAKCRSSSTVVCTPLAHQSWTRAWCCAGRAVGRWRCRPGQAAGARARGWPGAGVRPAAGAAGAQGGMRAASSPAWARAIRGAGGRSWPRQSAETCPCRPRPAGASTWPGCSARCSSDKAPARPMRAGRALQCRAQGHGSAGGGARGGIAAGARAREGLGHQLAQRQRGAAGRRAMYAGQHGVEGIELLQRAGRGRGPGSAAAPVRAWGLRLRVAG